jgi:hypothetical protein
MKNMVRLILENCENIDLPFDVINDLKIEDITYSYRMVGGKINKSQIANKVQLVINNLGNKEDYYFSIDDCHLPFERLHKHNDITAIVIFNENSEEEEFLVKYIRDYKEDNSLQLSYIRSDSLVIKIG